MYSVLRSEGIEPLVAALHAWPDDAARRQRVLWLEKQLALKSDEEIAEEQRTLDMVKAHLEAVRAQDDSS